MPLNERQKRFVDEYLIDLNAAAAYRRAGYAARGNAAEVNASRLLRHAQVRAAIEERQRVRLQSTQITAERVLQEIARIAFLDPRGFFRADGSLRPLHELSDVQASALSSIESFEEFAGSGENRAKVGDVRKIKFWDKVRALTELSRHLGLAPERHEVTGKGGGPIEHAHAHTLSDAERLERVAALFDRVRTRNAGSPADGSPGPA
jgi:phage terminase small subunit